MELFKTFSRVYGSVSVEGSQPHPCIRVLGGLVITPGLLAGSTAKKAHAVFTSDGNATRTVTLHPERCYHLIKEADGEVVMTVVAINDGVLQDAFHANLFDCKRSESEFFLLNHDGSSKPVSMKQQQAPHYTATGDVHDDANGDELMLAIISSQLSFVGILLKNKRVILLDELLQSDVVFRRVASTFASHWLEYAGSALVEGRQDVPLDALKNLMFAKTFCGTPVHAWKSAGKPINIIAIDGGGMRGLIALEIMSEILKECPNALDSFDIICGTSTGGILAVALLEGKTPEECIDVYKSMGRQVFDSWWTTRMFGWMTAGARYSASTLQKLFEQYLGGGNRALKSLQRERTCCFVVTTRYDTSPSTYLLRSYDNKTSFYEGTPNATISAALRASTAAPTYFKPVDSIDTAASPIVGTFIDGGVLANNPTELALMEAKRLWPDRELGLVLSIGTGIPNDRKHGGSLIAFASQCVDLVMGSVEIDKRVRHYLELYEPKASYVRLSPPGLGDIDLSTCDTKTLDMMIGHAKLFMSQPEQRASVLMIKQLLSNELPVH